MRPPSLQLSTRRAGVVLHPTCLPGPHGLGDAGPEAYRFVDWLAAAGQKVWQMLPLNPVGPGDSPYQCPSAFAGSGLMVALQPLVDQGWLPAASIARPPRWARDRVDYGRAIPWRWARLREAAAGFFAHGSAADHADFERWQRRERAWLTEWTLFAALKDAHGGRPWWDWAPELVRREPAALARVRRTLARERAEHAFVQWCFDTQMAALHRHARERGVLLMGDLPIFVAHDSADVWARPDLFHMNDRHELTVVAGVPPDGYTPDGQRWGNPIYRWDRMAAEGYGWWVARVRRAFAHADILRIDHFRGFAGYWEVPASCPTAREGHWAPGPGAALFEAIETQLGSLPIVAEDLGTITPDVLALRERFGFPGMRIVYEGFMYGPDHPFLPHHHEPRTLAYTSTHDSDTVRGWWRGSTPQGRAMAAALLGLDAQDAEAPIHEALWRATISSVACLALAQMQDLLGLGSEHRMNRPGTAEGNWGWRFSWPQVDKTLAARLARATAASAR
jgi:4-alpha-glucanotransferase